MSRLKRRVADRAVLSLVDSYLKQGVIKDLATWTPAEGTPRGAVSSPLLSNIFLEPLDQAMAAAGFEMVRYADDFVILCRSTAAAKAALRLVAQWTAAVGLALHPEKTHLVDAKQPGGFDFLGYHFERGYRWPRKKSLGKLKDTLRRQSKRAHGHSLVDIISDLNRTLQGWCEYFKHSHKTTFPSVDKWLRMRLRSILRKRRGGRGRGRGSDHQCWPNAFFAKQGLFSLTTAYALACQSSRR